MRITSFIKQHIKLLTAAGLILALIPVSLMVICYYIINPYKKFVVMPANAQHSKVGLVLGAGVNKEGKPYKELQARLDVAADALDKGTVDKLLLSGDNRFTNYDEPSAMKQYLVTSRHIPAEKLQVDFAGRSTYESCERAAKIFQLQRVIIFSADSHLPRAIYLCRHFGIDAYGVGSGVEASNSSRRELLARVKAVYNIHILGEHTVLGDPIPLN